MHRLAILSLACFLLPDLSGRSSQKISLPLIPGLSRADIYVEPYRGEARATLVLCPGLNGCGKELVDSPAWSDFARQEKLNLLGLSFASDPGPDDRGYFRANTGSGMLLLNGISKAFGPESKPLLFYGFSRGAQFVYSFVTWRPQGMLAWCAYSATEWEEPARTVASAKGIIACGDQDESNYSRSMFQFLKGRSMEMPWTWVSLHNQGHSLSKPLDDFLRAYFKVLLDNRSGPGMWLDVDTKIPLTNAAVAARPTLATWLPDDTSASIWRDLHQP